MIIVIANSLNRRESRVQNKKTRYIAFFVYNINLLLTSKTQVISAKAGFFMIKKGIYLYTFFELYILHRTHLRKIQMECLEMILNTPQSPQGER